MTNEELCLLIQHGSDKKSYLEELYSQNKNMIAQIARKYSTYAEYDDLSQEGYFGLLKAAETFDQGKGTQFSTHAYMHIRACILRYIENNTSTIRIPSGQRAKIMKMDRIIEDYYKEHSKEPDVDELADLMNVSKEKVLQLIGDALFIDIKSLNETVFDDGYSCCRGDCIEDEHDQYEDAVNEIDNIKLKSILWEIVDSLDPLQSRIIHERYENNNDTSSIGEMLNIPACKVRSAENGAMRELRKQKYYYRLRSFLDDQMYSISINHIGYRYFNTTWTSSTEKAALYAESLK